MGTSCTYGLISGAACMAGINYQEANTLGTAGPGLAWHGAAWWGVAGHGKARTLKDMTFRPGATNPAPERSARLL